MPAEGAEVIPLGQRGRAAASVASVVQTAAAPVSVVWSRPTVDEWGRDARLIDVLGPFARLRWDISVAGIEHVADGPALIVANTRMMALTPITTAWAVGESLGRPVRFAGRPDIVPFGPILRRIGGLLREPDEIAGALRAGQVVVVGAHSTAHPRHAGTVDPALVATAIREGVPLHAAATLSTLAGRRARIEITKALSLRHKRRGPLAEVELAELTQRRLQDLLDEFGGSRTGLPGLAWLGEG